VKRLIIALTHPGDYSWWQLRPWRRHSMVLLVAGLVYVGIGVAYMLSPANPVRDATLRVPLTWMPLAAWGVLFIVVGALAVLSARWPPASETWGYTALSGLSALWSMFYLWGTVLGAGPSAAPGLFVWGLMAFLWWAISGLHNPADMPAPTEH
jgi:hypothetical protein